MKSWLIDRSTEQGTYRGLIMLIGSMAGMSIDSGVSESLAALLVSCAAAGLHNIVTKG